MLSRRFVDKACEDWWDGKAEEMERLLETTERLAHSGSLLKDLKKMKSR